MNSSNKENHLSEAELVEHLVALLQVDSTDGRAAEHLVCVVESGEIDPMAAMRAYQAAIRLQYFRKQ